MGIPTLSPHSLDKPSQIAQPEFCELALHGKSYKILKYTTYLKLTILEIFEIQYAEPTSTVLGTRAKTKGRMRDSP